VPDQIRSRPARQPESTPAVGATPAPSATRGNQFYQDLLREVPPPAPGGGGAWSAVIDRIWEGAEADQAKAPDVEPEGVGRGAQPEPGASQGIEVSPSGRAAMDGLAAVASTRKNEPPRGKCYNYVMGAGGNAYVNRAAAEKGTKRWQQLADRIPSSHSAWAVSFAHWLQETPSGRKAAKELGFVIYESDGKTRLGDYLAARPELKGSVVVIPYGQQGTASREWNAAANYGDKKWGAGVGDISVVTEIGAKGATYVADGGVPHDEATMWWVVYPK
jgi:hypothetical protein